MEFAERWRTALVVLASAASIIMAPGPPAKASVRVFQQVRQYALDGRDGGVLVLQGSVEARGAAGALAFVGGSAPRTGALPTQVMSPTLLDLGPLRDGMYGLSGRRDLCEGASITCEVSSDGQRVDFTYVAAVDPTRGPAIHQRLFVVTIGTKVKVSASGQHWQAKQPSATLSRVAGETADAQGARLLGLRAAVAPQASAVVPARGSIAIGVPACDDAGVGAFTLMSAHSSTRAYCPSGPVAGVDTGSGSWTLSATAVGTTEYTTRLLVFGVTP